MAEAIKNYSNNNGELVLVTGGSGFVGIFCIIELLQQGYRVRTTVRALKREADVRSMLKQAGIEAGAALTFAQADLLSDTDWAEAVAGCTYVLHVASPFPLSSPKDENELIIPAREGSLRVLKAARNAGVKRLVLTSSFAAIGYGESIGRPFNETDWTYPNGKIGAYIKSKTIAELAAWEFIKQEGGTLEMSVVNPVGIFGPALGNDYSSSIQIIQRMMEGKLPAVPDIATGVVDVRDVADLHVRAMTSPAANGERFLAVAGDFVSLPEIARILKKNLGNDAAKVATRVAPNWLFKLLGLFNGEMKMVSNELGKQKNGTNKKAREVLGWKPRTTEEAIVASGKSLAGK